MKPIHGAPAPKNVVPGMILTAPAACPFKVGDAVKYTNDQGVVFTPRHVRGFAADPRFERVVYLEPSTVDRRGFDCWWIAVKLSNLTLLKP